MGGKAQLGGSTGWGLCRSTLGPSCQCGQPGGPVCYTDLGRFKPPSGPASEPSTSEDLTMVVVLDHMRYVSLSEFLSVSGLVHLNDFEGGDCEAVIEGR